jgi:hypothetical protein
MVCKKRFMRLRRRRRLAADLADGVVVRHEE